MNLDQAISNLCNRYLAPGEARYHVHERAFGDRGKVIFGSYGSDGRLIRDLECFVTITDHERPQYPAMLERRPPVHA